MHASEVLRKCIPDALSTLHTHTARVLLRGVDALVRGRRLVLMDLARSWPGAERVWAPLKALDRLLSNVRVARAREAIYAENARWLGSYCGPQPVVAVDWSTLKADEPQHLLRAGLAVGGRTLTIWEEVHPQEAVGSAQVHRRFLERLARMFPDGVQVYLLTDAGFGCPWFAAAEALGFQCVGRLRGTAKVKPVEEEDVSENWVGCRNLHELALTRPRDLGRFEITRSSRAQARLVVATKPGKGRVHRNRRGQRAGSSASRAQARGQREPWVLRVSPGLAALDARALVALYAQRMQIEEAFRDLKSERYGAGFELSLTRKGARIEALLLLHALATLAAWIAGHRVQQQGECWRYQPHRQAWRRGALSLIRIGWEAIRQGWLKNIRRPPPCSGNMPPDPLLQPAKCV